MLKTALNYSHELLKEVLQPGDTAVDATMGNGYDTCLLAEAVGRTGHVYAFDLQTQAVTNTRQKLSRGGLLERVTLFQQGHETLGEVLPLTQQIKAAVFNLGYLPQSDKTIITLPATTQQALEALLLRLAPRGRIIIVAYYGHAGGETELVAVEHFCQALPQADYNVLRYQFINQKNQPPILYCIEKKAKRAEPVQ